jgi:hypothetical protein
MNVSIADYIEKTYTVEMQEILKKGFDLFDRLNLETYEGFILNTLNNIENEDPTFISTNVTGYVEGLIVQLAKSFGFTLADYGDITLEQRIDFVRGYVDLEDFLDHDAVVRIVETDMSDAEKLAEAIALTTDYGIDNLLSFIIDVDEAALMTLSRLHQQAIPGEEVVDEQDGPTADEDQVRNVKAYELFMKEFNLSVDCYQLVRMGFPIGAPFQMYWQQYKDVILTADRATLTKEIIGLFLLSKEHWTNPLLAFNNLSEELFDSVSIITECNVELRQLYNNFIKFKAENKIK